MQCLVIALAFLAVINVATCQYYQRSTGLDNSDYLSSAKYLQYMKQRNQLDRFRSQFETICPDKADELDSALIKLKGCTDGIDENTETACSAIKNHFLKCSKPMVDVLEQCLPENAKEVPSLVFNAVNSVSRYLCKTDGEHIFELVNSCIYKTNYKTMRCERRLRAKLQQYKNAPPSKNDLCELAKSMKPCLQTHLQESCGNSITRESFLGIFDAMTSPCQIAVDNQVSYNTINEVELLE